LLFLSSGQQLHAGAHQFVEIARALADAGGVPCKGVKANMTKILERRYSHVIQSSVETLPLPQTIVIDAMFIINTSPLKIKIP
jgi:hypothetical protein